MQDKYTDVKEVESTKKTSALTGARSTSEFIQASDGKDSTALDSTQATSTLEGARSVEQIMNELKEEEKAKKSKSSSVTDKWKKAGVNAKSAATGAKETAETAVDSVTDTVSDVKDSSIGKIATAAITGRMPAFSSPLMTAAVSFGASKLGMSGLSGLSASSDETTVDPTKVSETMSKSAPTDTAIATYQKDVTEASKNGANVKRLPFTNEHQTQWNAQDQHRMYSNYGMMYEHGPNEMSYNMALLSATMSTAGLPTKTLLQVPSFKQKYLSEVQKDDNQMDINNMSMDKLFSGEVDLLHAGEQSVTEDMSVINRSTQTADKYAASDHQLDTRDADKKDIAASFAEATKQSVKAFTDSVIDRGATVDADLAGVGVNLTGGESKEPELSSDFF